MQQRESPRSGFIFQQRMQGADDSRPHKISESPVYLHDKYREQIRLKPSKGGLRRIQRNESRYIL